MTCKICVRVQFGVSKLNGGNLDGDLGPHQRAPRAVRLRAFRGRYRVPTLALSIRLTLIPDGSELLNIGHCSFLALLKDNLRVLYITIMNHARLDAMHPFAQTDAWTMSVLHNQRSRKNRSEVEKLRELFRVLTNGRAGDLNIPDTLSRVGSSLRRFSDQLLLQFAFYFPTCHRLDFLT